MVEYKSNAEDYALETLLGSIAKEYTPLVLESSLELQSPIEEINYLLIRAKKDLTNMKFNNIIHGWVDGFLGDDKKKIVTSNPLETVVNYLTYLKDRGYSSKTTQVSFENNRVILEMKDGCPYQRFCEGTKHTKCVRGQVMKSLQKGYSPVLDKSNFPNCKITLESPNQAMEDIFASVLNLEKETKVYLI